MRSLFLLFFLLLAGCAKAPLDPGMQRTVSIPVFDQPARPWLMTPVVKVCPDAPVGEAEVQNVLALWEQHGAPRLKVRYAPCWESRPLPGYVYIRGNTYDGAHPQWQWDHSVLGLTYYSAGGINSELPTWWAVIELSDNDRRVLTHEVGHLWLGHANVGPHVLFPTIQGFHWKGWLGVDAAFKDGGY
jgi:hypothetical protein